MHVIINTTALTGEEVPINSTAAEVVRMGFNPSTLPPVDRIKALAAALVSECENIRDENRDAAREASIAITEIQGATMFAVAAATKGL